MMGIWLAMAACCLQAVCAPGAVLSKLGPQTMPPLRSKKLSRPKALVSFWVASGAVCCGACVEAGAAQLQAHGV